MSDKQELKSLMERTGLLVFLDAPRGHEVYRPGEREPITAEAKKPALLAWLRGYAAGMRAEEKGGGE